MFIQIVGICYISLQTVASKKNNEKCLFDFIKILVMNIDNILK